MEELYKGCAQRARDLAANADPFTRQRLLDLAQRYDLKSRTGSPSGRSIPPPRATPPSVLFPPPERLDGSLSPGPVRPSSHSVSDQSRMVSSPVLRRRSMIATLARAFSRATRARGDVKDLTIVAVIGAGGLLRSLLAIMAFGLSAGPNLF